MKKRAVAVIACVVATVVAVPGSTAIAQSQRFPDVPADHYAYEAIEWAAEAGVTAGYTDGTFKPQQPLRKSHAVVFMERYYDQILQADQSPDFTRGDMMVLLKTINDGTLRTGAATPQSSSAATGSQRFPDVPADHYAYEAIEWAAEAGVTAGYTDGTFKPQQPLRKSHAVVFMERYYDQILQADQSPDFTRGDMMVLLKTINDGTLRKQVSDVDCDFSDHSDRVRSAVYQVRTDSGIGTAFYIGHDKWLTAAHVVAGESTVTLHNGTNQLAATILGGNSEADMALLRAPGAGIAPLTFARLSSAKAGNLLFVVGYPLYVAEEPSIAGGVLSRTEKDRQLGTLIVTDASSNPGNSGGPVVNECGDVIGMIVSKLVAEDVEGIAYAIAETTLQERLPNMHSGGAESIAVVRTYEECFGSDVSQWHSEWTDGPRGWLYEVWQHQSDGRTGGSAYLDATRHTLNDFRNTLAEGCDFIPYLWVSCAAYESSEPFWLGIWWSGIPTGTTANSALSIEYRLDDGSRTNGIWIAGEDYASLSGVGAVSLMRQLRDANKFVFWGYDANGTQVIEAEFDTAGIAGSLEHLRDTCNWDSIEPPSPTPQQTRGSSAWIPFDGENISGRYVGAYTGVEISEYTWQDDWLLLFIRCSNRSILEVFFVVDGSSFFGNGGVIVEYRFGNQEEPASVLANAGTDHDTAFLSDILSFLHALRSDTSGRLFVNLWDWWTYTYSEDTFDFEGGGEISVVGVSEDVEPVLSACGY